MLTYLMVVANANTEDTDDFLNEINILKIIDKHPNVVGLIGYSFINNPCMMVMEYVPCGDLRNYLHDIRNQWNKRSNFQFNSIIE